MPVVHTQAHILKAYAKDFDSVSAYTVLRGTEHIANVLFKRKGSKNTLTAFVELIGDDSAPDFCVSGVSLGSPRVFGVTGNPPEAVATPPARRETDTLACLVDVFNEFKGCIPNTRVDLSAYKIRLSDIVSALTDTYSGGKYVSWVRNCNDFGFRVLKVV